MIFYRINALPPRVVGTQADAKREARGAKATFDQVDIPTDKAGLMAFVNGLLAATPEPFVHPEFGAPNSDPPEERRKQAEAGLVLNPVRQSQESFTASEIEDFILNRATVAQVENIFSTLGTRFAEQRIAA